MLENKKVRKCGLFYANKTVNYNEYLTLKVTNLGWIKFSV